MLGNRRPGVRRKPFEARGVGRRGSDDGGVLHRATVFEGLPNAGDRGALLADRHVYAPDLLVGIAGLPVLALVEDRVHTHRGLAGLAVADDQLALAATDGRLRVDRLDAGLQRLTHALTLHHRRRLQFQGASLVGLDVAAAVDRLTQRVDDASEEGVTDGYRQHLAGALDLLALLDFLEVAEDHRADVVLVEVERNAEHAAGELQQLLRHHRREAFDVRDAVTGVDDNADLLAFGVGFEAGDILLDGALDLVCRDRQLCHGFSSSYFVVGRGVVGSFGQVGLGRCQLGRQRAVDHLVADGDRQAADQCRIDVVAEAKRDDRRCESTVG